MANIHASNYMLKIYHNDSKFADRLGKTNSVDPDQTAAILGKQ